MTTRRRREMGWRRWNGKTRDSLLSHGKLNYQPSSRWFDKKGPVSDHRMLLLQFSWCWWRGGGSDFALGRPSLNTWCVSRAISERPWVRKLSPRVMSAISFRNLVTQTCFIGLVPASQKWTLPSLKAPRHPWRVNRMHCLFYWLFD